MPTKPERVYQDSGGAWYFKVTVGRDPLTGRREQITRRGFRTATEAGRARRDVLDKKDTGRIKPAPKLLTVDELLDLYLEGLDADGTLGARRASTTATTSMPMSALGSASARFATSLPR